MSKPEGWDSAKAMTPGESRKIEPGCYICKIRGAREEVTDKGKKRMVIAFDIDEGEYAGYYQERFARFPSNTFPGVFRQYIEGKSLPFFKGMITAIEESNPGYSYEKSGFEPATLKGKKFCGVFGEEEYMSSFSNQIEVTCRCQVIRSIKAMEDGEITLPKLKKYSGPAPVTADSFAEITDDDCPF